MYAIIKILGSFRVVHQTTGEVSLTSGAVVPLFCIASGHNLCLNYKWSKLGQHEDCCLGNTPVMWVDSPGIYRCQVSSQTAETCFSSNMVMKSEAGMSNLKTAMYVVDNEHVTADAEVEIVSAKVENDHGEIIVQSVVPGNCDV